MRLHVNKNTLIYAAAALFLLLTLGVGIAIVYSDYIYAANKGFFVMNVSAGDPDFLAVTMGQADDETYTRAQKKTQALADALDKWAEENHASLLLRSIIPFYPHISVAIYSDLAEKLEIQKIRAEETGLYMETQMYEDPYLTENGVFLPHQNAQKIEYIYDREGLPKGLQKRGYYFLSLKDYKLPAGNPYIAQIFTDAKDIAGLLNILEEYRVGYSNIQANEDDPLTRLKGLFYPIGFYNGVLLLTLAAAAGGFLFLTLIQFRNEAAFRIRHLNGKPLYRIAADIILSGVVLYIIAYGILYILMPKYCTYMTAYDIGKIRAWVGGALFAITLLSYGAASGRLLSKLRRR